MAKRPRDEDELAIEAEALARGSMIARIQARMRLLNLNAFSAAKKAGLGADYVRDLIRGKVKNPSAEKLGKLAEALECSLYYLMGQQEIESRFVSHAPGRQPQEATLPPPPSPTWRPSDAKPQAALLPIRFELMADTFRKATDVVRPPIGYEAATIPPQYADREIWWELVRDDSVARVAPSGSLVLVVAMNDDEREQIAHGEFVIVVKRLVGPDSAYNLQERSMRRVVYRYQDLGLWFLEYAYLDEDLNVTDEIWREQEPTAPRRTLDELASEIEDPEDRAAALSANEALRKGIEAQQERAKERAAAGDFDEAFKRMDDPDWLTETMDGYRKWRPRLVGKVIRVLVDVDPRAPFGIA